MRTAPGTPSTGSPGSAGWPGSTESPGSTASMEPTVSTLSTGSTGSAGATAATGSGGPAGAVGPGRALRRAGVVAFVIGLVVDLVGHAWLPMLEHDAHVVVVVGMALILAGVVVDGVRRQSPAPHPATGKEVPHAVR